jgi:hypothetical protein
MDDVAVCWFIKNIYIYIYYCLNDIKPSHRGDFMLCIYTSDIYDKYRRSTARGPLKYLNLGYCRHIYSTGLEQFFFCSCWKIKPEIEPYQFAQK